MRTTICRAKKNDCDVDDYCDGITPTCPADVVAINGLACGDARICVNGGCVDADSRAGSVPDRSDESEAIGCEAARSSRGNWELPIMVLLGLSIVRRSRRQVGCSRQ